MVEIGSIKGPLLESEHGANIFQGFPYNLYEIIPSNLNKEELRKATILIKIILRASSLNSLISELGPKKDSIIEQFRNGVVQFVDINSLVQILPTAKQLEILRLNLLPITEVLGIKHKQDFLVHVLNSTVGYGDLSSLMLDPQLEEIMINGFNRNVFVFHRKYGNCKTNILVNEKSRVFNLIKRISATVGRQFNEVHPLLDARLPDGSRANATFNYVSPFGHTLTIRKFSSIPISIIDLISNETLDAELAAFLWAMIHGLGMHPMNTIITGGTGSGKTTFMNVLISFIPFEERIISIEDTIELDLGVIENWIQMETKPKIKDVHAVSMDDLLKNTLRMRPDRIIVGEVRGAESQTLFVAMDTGHRGILGTLHSNSAREMILRLKNAPMDVPEQMIPLLDMVIVMQRHYRKDKGIIRKIKQVAEIGRMDETVLLNNIFELNEKTGQTARAKIPSSLIEKLATAIGMTKNELKKEIQIRKKILQYMLEVGIRERNLVEALIQQYYFDPEIILRKTANHFRKR